MGEEQQTTPEEQVKRLYGEAEKQTASAVEQLVHSDSFGELLARLTQNVMGVTKIGFDVLDLTVRNLRLAGRPDLIRLGRQLNRNEDKLERVLQEVETLQSEVKQLRSSNGSSGGTKRRSTNGRTRTKSKSS
jgi:hypothetical protein